MYAPAWTEARTETTKALDCRIRVQSFVLSTRSESRRAAKFCWYRIPFIGRNEQIETHFPRGGEQFSIGEFSPASFISGFNLMPRKCVRKGAGVLWSRRIRILSHA